ncbi:hypothetical protein GN244_ATG07582 [Phytophthora infestans]|uniref:Uncharacterized protein n=1 Tax=Phytophthora infestans TaxID=4787 RepID=A0A833SW96_PHYIN|nr:hypothetical protein GN244_ATG07582 [Phytophthora infestans]KAF4129424.1 hypothetical protein GN958_ATG21379 [Phytophthora infestans]
MRAGKFALLPVQLNLQRMQGKSRTQRVAQHKAATSSVACNLASDRLLPVNVAFRRFDAR